MAFGIHWTDSSSIETVNPYMYLGLQAITFTAAYTATYLMTQVEVQAAVLRTLHQMSELSLTVTGLVGRASQMLL